ncbi:MAG: ABC transporter ATP-binding protein [Flavobacteriaceae bacterium]|tara:strand:- start:2886 stop:3551 length:666 start_codon:yes stop_codon:yes gene_type:complete
MGILLKANNISKDFGNLKVLDKVSIKVEEKEIVAIVGPSGAGKTTLLNILGTLDNPNYDLETSIIIDGQDVTNMTDNSIAKFRNNNIGFIFQFHELLPEFTALENVCIPSWLNKENVNVEDKAKDLLSRIGIIDKINQKPNELSGGERQRVAVARALINRPKIIFADEPSGNLDSDNANQLHNIFFDLRNELNCSFVIVTHNNDLAKRADRLINLKDGQIN